MPKGRQLRVKIVDLLASKVWSKADKPVAADLEGSAFLFVPEYASSRVTANLEEQTVAPKAVYRFAVDQSKVDVQFLARLLNSPLGRTLRERVSGGATIPRISPHILIEQTLPIPDAPTQARIAHIDREVALLRSDLADHLRLVDTDWRRLDDVAEKLAALKAATSVERRIDDWWQELPYPLASIYRRYRFSKDAKERLSIGLHFFEVFAVYLAAVGRAHVRALRSDAATALDDLAYPPKMAGIERADFGFWINFAQGCGKELKRTLGDRDLRVAASDYAGPSLVGAAEMLMSVGEAAAILNGPRDIRNRFAHGGHVKESDAEELVAEMQAPISSLYALCAPIFRRMWLVRLGSPDMDDEGYAYRAEVLRGSDPTFEHTSFHTAQRGNTNSLAFWHHEQQDLVVNVPFFMLGKPTKPSERTVYVYNRVENGALHWVSYQEAQEQTASTDTRALRGIVRDPT